MPKKREIKSIQQLDNIVRNNTEKALQQMIENGDLLWDKSKYAILPVQKDPSISELRRNGNNLNPTTLSANENKDLSQSGLKAAFQPEYALSLNELTGAGSVANNRFHLSFESLSKTDQILSEGYQWKENRTEYLGVKADVNNYGKKIKCDISEFENKDGVKQHLITIGPDMVQMSYKQILGRQKYLENHPPQWVNDAVQFSEETGWDKKECTELFRMMNSDRSLKNALPYEPGDRESISDFAQDYKNDIQVMVQGMASSENWHFMPDTSDTLSFYIPSSSQCDLNKELNECGMRRTYDAFTYVTSDGGTGALMSVGDVDWSDSASVWHDFNIKMGQEYVREQMNSIGNYRDFVKNLPERNIGHVATVLDMKQEIVDYIAKEGSPRDMRNYLTVSDQTIGKNFVCPQEVASTAYEVVRSREENGFKTYGFNRSDVIPITAAIHQAENFTDPEKKELSIAAITNIHEHSEQDPSAIQNNKHMFRYMLQSESKDFILDYLKDDAVFGQSKKERDFLTKRINHTISSMEGTFSLKNIHEALCKEFDDPSFGSKSHFLMNVKQPHFNFTVDKNGISLPIDEKALPCLTQAIEQSRVEMKELVTELAHSALNEIEVLGKDEYGSYQYAESIHEWEKSVMIEFSDDYSLCREFSVSVVLHTGAIEETRLSQENAERLLMEHIQNSYEAVLDEKEGNFSLVPKESTIFPPEMTMQETGNEYLVCPVFSADGPDYSEFGYAGAPGSVLVKNGEVIEDSFRVNAGWEEQQKKFDQIREAAVVNVLATENSTIRDESAILQQIAKQENCSIKCLSIDNQNMVTRTIMRPDGDTMDIVLGKYEDGKLDRTYEPDKELKNEAAEIAETGMDMTEELDEQDSFDSQDF